ncbi:MAG: Hsp20/alpha crystallin family protein [Sulfurovum sp.]|uniref:Hsp20/alpha crystallin family protein n=1 Tax=Sulfurovum sp. TaxID=1969726 RepID=UPI003C737319
MFSKKISLFILPLIAISSLQANDPFFNDPFGDDIFKEMYQMQKEMDKIFERMNERMEQRTKLWNYPSRQNLIPKNNIRSQSELIDKGTHYEYNTQIPESKNNQIDISIVDGILHLKATVDTVKKSNQSNMKMQQHYISMIQRSETLPNDTDPSTLKSEYKNGVLVLILQKKKSIQHSVVKEKEKEVPVEDVPKEEKQIETNTTKVRVPHTSSHV